MDCCWSLLLALNNSKCSLYQMMASTVSRDGSQNSKFQSHFPGQAKRPNFLCVCVCIFFFFFLPSLKARECLTNQAVSPWRCEPVGDSWSRATQASRMPHSMGQFQTPRRSPSLTFPKVLGACFSRCGRGGALLSSVDISSNADKAFHPLKATKG